MEADSVAVEERHRLALHSEQERDAEDVAVERDGPIDVGHAHVDLPDRSEPIERHAAPPTLDRD